MNGSALPIHCYHRMPSCVSLISIPLSIESYWVLFNGVLVTVRVSKLPSFQNLMKGRNNSSLIPLFAVSSPWRLFCIFLHGKSISMIVFSTVFPILIRSTRRWILETRNKLPVSNLISSFFAIPPLFWPIQASSCGCIS